MKSNPPNYGGIYSFFNSSCHYHVLLLPNAAKAVGSVEIPRELWYSTLNIFGVFFPVTEIQHFKELFWLEENAKSSFKSSN